MVIWPQSRYSLSTAPRTSGDSLGSNKKLTTVNRLLWNRDVYRLYGCHPLGAGLKRIKRRHDRRHGMALENPVVFYARYWGSEIRNISSMLTTYWRLRRTLRRIWTDPQRHAYRDLAITPPDADELKLSLYTETRGTSEAIDKRRKGIMRSVRVREGRKAHDEVDEHDVA